MVHDFFRDSRGATAVEYSLIAALVILVLLVGLIVMTGSMNDMYAGSGGSLSGTIGGGS